MFRTLDLKRLVIAADDPEAATRVLEVAFGFARTDGPGDTPRLAIGNAEIEARSVECESGLSRLVLEVDDLEAAADALARRGIDASRRELDGRAALDVPAAQTHGAPLTLVAKSRA